MAQKFEKIVPDTSVLVEGILSRRIASGEYSVREIVLHEGVVAECEYNANMGRAIGLLGIDELSRISKLATKGGFQLRFAGERPKPHELENSKVGDIDAKIRDLAWEEDAVLLTSDPVQAQVAKAKGVKVILVDKGSAKDKLILESYFDDTTMSVHLRENVLPFAKKGRPGAWEFVELSKKLLTANDIRKISTDIIEQARIRDDGFIEVERNNSTIVQLGRYRIVMTQPPFSDASEITAVRPITKLTLDDYKLDEKILGRIAARAEGILIAGAPGHGKSTFAQALAERYAEGGKIVKTIEAPRDLQLSDNITQYSLSRGTPKEIHDTLLLSRPDFTIFDELRNPEDFSFHILLYNQ